MIKCSNYCIPCCDFCIHCEHDEISCPVKCTIDKIPEDKFTGADYCDDFHCFRVEDVIVVDDAKEGASAAFKQVLDKYEV